MKAIATRSYGSADVLELVDVPDPVPGPDDVLVRVRAAGLNALDWRLMRGTPVLVRLFYGLRRPRYPHPGRDVAGVVEAVGANVTRFVPGDAVFGVCHGAFAELARAAQSQLAMKPLDASWEQAGVAAIAGFTALQGLRDAGRLRAGQHVLVNGASGGVGSFAVQIAKAFDAHVTGVCSSRNVELVRTLGADHVIDYTAEDFTLGETRYDLVLDCIGNHRPAALRRVLTPEGTCVTAGVSGGLWPYLRQSTLAAIESLRGQQRFVSLLSKQRCTDLVVLRDLLAAGQLAPSIERTYPLHEAADAVRHLESGRARGKVVILPTIG